MLVHLLQMQVCVRARTYLRALPCSAELVAADLYFRQSGCCHTVAESFSKIFRGVKHLNYTDDGGRALR